jgi:hypothetical protein
MAAGDSNLGGLTGLYLFQNVVGSRCVMVPWIDVQYHGTGLTEGVLQYYRTGGCSKVKHCTRSTPVLLDLSCTRVLVVVHHMVFRLNCTDYR